MPPLSPTIDIRQALPSDAAGLWAVLEPVIRAGETYALDAGQPADAAIAAWIGGDHTAFVAEQDCRIVGTYYLRPNQAGGGRHVCNAGFAVGEDSRGQGVARRMGEDALARAKASGYSAMQFNFVVSTNRAAVHLWRALGFEIVGRLPGAFRHPTQGEVDALVMHRRL